MNSQAQLPMNEEVIETLRIKTNNIFTEYMIVHEPIGDEEMKYALQQMRDIYHATKLGDSKVIPFHNPSRESCTGEYLTHVYQILDGVVVFGLQKTGKWANHQIFVSLVRGGNMELLYAVKRIMTTFRRVFHMTEYDETHI